MTDAQKTPLYDLHVEAKAQICEFAGWLLPIKYNSEKQEHLAVRNAAGLFDVSHMGEIIAEGEDAYNFLQQVLSNNLEHIKVGQAQYTLLLNEEAGIIDDLIVYQLNSKKYLLCVNAGNTNTDYEWLKKRAKHYNKLELSNQSKDYAQIAIQGPASLKMLNKLLDKESLPPKFHIKELSFFNGIKTLLASTGYTGEAGYEIFVRPKDACLLWQLLLKEGAEFGLIPCGLAARDSLRLEAGLLLHGVDISNSTTPLQARLMFAVDLSKKEFIGKSVLLKEKAQGPKKLLIGFRLLEKGIARAHCDILNEKSELIGEVSSGSLSPGQELGFGIGYVKSAYANIDQPIKINIRNRLVAALIVKPRFLPVH